MRILSKITLTLIAIQMMIQLIGLSAIGYSGEGAQFIDVHYIEKNASSLRPQTGTVLDYLQFAGWGMQTGITFMFDIVWNSITGGTIENLILMFDPTGGEILGVFATSIRLLVVTIFVLGIVEYLRG